MKTQAKIFLAVCLLTPLCFLGAFFIASVQFKNKHQLVQALKDKYQWNISFTEDEWQDFSVTKTIPVESLKAVQVSLATADLKVEEGSSNHIEIAVQGKAESAENVFATKTINEQLEISLAEGVLNDGHVKILLPKQIKQLKIESAAGDIKVDSQSLQILKIQSSAGDIRAVIKEKAPHVTIESTAGDVKLFFAQNLSAKVNVSALAGDLNLWGQKYNGFASEIKVSKGASQGQIKIEAAAGDIEVSDFE